MRCTLGSVLTLLLLLPPGCAEPDREGSVSGSGAEPSAQDETEIDRLRALGYAGVAEALDEDEEVGVVFHDRERAAPGINLFTNANLCSADLMDMDGRVLHSWSHEPCFRWENAVLLPNGDLLVAGRVPYDRSSAEEAAVARYLTLLAWDGSVRWEQPLSAHHDAELAPDGRILALALRHRMLPAVHKKHPVKDHLIVELSRAGEVLREVSLFDAIRSSQDVFSLQPIRPREFDGVMEVDLFHSNSVEAMRHPGLVGRHAIYDPGNVLVCIRNQDTLAVFDLEAQRVLWAWGQGEISGPHDATLLANGNILAFDNGLGRDWSRVIELDPIERRIVWEYRAPDPESFYTGTRGSNQRLANGNTLIVESDNGRAFEVTESGEVVWRFVNSNLTAQREPSVIVRMRRYEGLAFEDLLARVREDALELRD